VLVFFCISLSCVVANAIWARLICANQAILGNCNAKISVFYFHVCWQSQSCVFNRVASLFTTWDRDTTDRVSR
jgi:hypothetical protein